jgi:hypothetical protein
VRCDDRTHEDLIGIVGVLDRQPTTGVPEVDECDSPRSVTRRKRHVSHNLDRFGLRDV